MTDPGYYKGIPQARWYDLYTILGSAWNILFLHLGRGLIYSIYVGTQCLNCQSLFQSEKPLCHVVLSLRQMVMFIHNCVAHATASTCTQTFDGR